MVGQPDDHLIRYIVEECSQEVGVLQVGIVTETYNLTVAPHFCICLQTVQPSKMIQTVELTNSVQDFMQEQSLFTTHLLLKNRE